MPRPCVGCGFEVDENEDLVYAGVEPRDFAYGVSEPQYAFCDSSSGMLWHKPANLPWGRYWSQSGAEAVIGYPIFGVVGAYSPANYAAALAGASLLVDTPYVREDVAVLDSAIRAYSASFECYFSTGAGATTLTYVRLVRDVDNGAGLVSTEVGLWEHQADNNRPFTVATDVVYARMVKWRLQAFFVGTGPVYAMRVNAICRDEGLPIVGILGNQEPGAGTYYG